MPTLTGSIKWSYKYTMVNASGDNPLTRTISGLNVNTSTAYPETGVTNANAINFCTEIARAFSLGRVDAIRWIQEQEVTP